MLIKLGVHIRINSIQNLDQVMLNSKSDWIGSEIWKFWKHSYFNKNHKSMKLRQTNKLFVAKTFNISRLILRTNSYVFRCLCRDLVSLRTTRVLASDIKKLASNFEDIKIQVIYREANLAADLLTRIASSRFRLKVVPPNLLSLSCTI